MNNDIFENLNVVGRGRLTPPVWMNWRHSAMPPYNRLVAGYFIPIRGLDCMNPVKRFARLIEFRREKFS